MKTVSLSAVGSVAAPSGLAGRAVELARNLLEKANQGMQADERRQSRQMAGLMDDAAGKALTLQLADQIFLPPERVRGAQLFHNLVSSYGVPSYLPKHEQWAMQVGAIAAPWLPGMVMPIVQAKMRQESADVILNSERKKLLPHLAQKHRQGFRANINQLGEAVLGAEEAGKRLQEVIDLLALPACNYISVKVSAIYAGINLVAYEQTRAEIKQRLRTLYQAAINSSPKDPKFVNLDMEEYRDLQLTCEAFMEVLGEPAFRKLNAGIVLQAYLPDAFDWLQKLTAFARERVDSGGVGIKVRLVKGANLAMERVDAILHGWELAPYDNKADVDANFKRLLHFATQPENAKVVRLGVASHNLFDISYALMLREEQGVGDCVEFEMLEGMASHQARVVKEKAGSLLMYTPVVSPQDFPAAIAYLVRRLDENTTPENFLHDLFGMQVGDANWETQKQRFLGAVERLPEVKSGPRRVQDRATEQVTFSKEIPFRNAADTDWSLPPNREWLRSELDRLEIPTDAGPVVNGERTAATDSAQSFNPSVPGICYAFDRADRSQVELALETAVTARQSWANRPLAEREGLLLQAAEKLTYYRGRAIAVMQKEAAKAVAEGDAEVSEAIDFANYYARCLSIETLAGVKGEPLGTILVTPPWNFPFAIPCGGILAALVAGNTVIFKPAPETVITGWILAQALWEAGVPREVLQFLPCPDNEIGRRLVTDDRVSGVILTGAYATAKMFRDWKPELRLFAETSGKNALIITDAADPDLAIKDLVKSAFGHAGQKCSAASLALIERGLHDSPAFLSRLKNAVETLRTRSAHDLMSDVTPLVQAPGPELKRALTSLDPGEIWLVEPKMIDDNPCLWSPGVKIGVKPDHWFRRTECFGPVLGIIRCEDLEQAIAIQNDTDFALTGGIHSLDQKEITRWRQEVEVGNCYINRPITGAIVQRQPFGGWKNSCFGPGAKAGGPNYPFMFQKWAKPDRLDLDEVRLSYREAWHQHFALEHDPSNLRVEQNLFRYRPLQELWFCPDGFCEKETEAVKLGAEITGVTLRHLTQAELSNDPTPPAKFCRLWIKSPKARILTFCHKNHLGIIDQEITGNGRLDLLPFFLEQSVSETKHRHGCMIPTADELQSVSP